MKYDSFAKLLRTAIDDDPAAIEEILKQYMPIINRNSIVNGKFDEDCRQYILLRVAKQITNFKF